MEQGEKEGELMECKDRNKNQRRRRIRHLNGRLFQRLWGRSVGENGGNGRETSSIEKGEGNGPEGGEIKSEIWKVRGSGRVSEGLNANRCRPNPPDSNMGKQGEETPFNIVEGW